MARGLFLTFEGIDGSGKSTQARLLVQRLQAEEIPVVHTREPGGTNLEISEKIRNLILNHKTVNMASETELLLFMASRAQHVQQLILPNLAKGVHVVCDRFSDASIAYQGYGRGLDLSWIEKLDGFARQGLSPDRTFLLDVSEKEFLSRKRADNGSYDRIERSGADFQRKVREGYLTLARENPKRVLRLDGMLSRETLAQAVYENVAQTMQSAQAIGQKA